MAFSSISIEKGWQKQTAASEFPADKKAGNGMVLFPSVRVVTWNLVLKSLCTLAVGVTNEVWFFISNN